MTTIRKEQNLRLFLALSRERRFSLEVLMIPVFMNTNVHLQEIVYHSVSQYDRPVFPEYITL